MSIVLPTSGNLEKNTSCMLAYATHTLSHSTSNGMPGTHKAQAMVGWALKLQKKMKKKRKKTKHDTNKKHDNNNTNNNKKKTNEE